MTRAAEPRGARAVGSPLHDSPPMLRPILLVALWLALPAAAQPTPATPGAAGAEAAVSALVRAQKVGDWAAVVGLLEPKLVADLGSSTWLFAEGFSQALALANADASFREEYGGDDGPTLRAARRLAAVFPPNERLSIAETVARVLTTDAPQTAWRAEESRQTAFAVLGSVAEADTLAHVVGRLDRPVMGEVRSTVELVTVRRTGERWAVVIGRDTANPLLEYLRFATGNWAEILGHVVADEAPDGGAMEDRMMGDGE